MAEAVSVALALAALTAALAAYRRASEAAARAAELAEKLQGLERTASMLSRSVGFVERALAPALASLEAEEALERLRRRRRRRYIAFYVVSEDGASPEPGDIEKAVLRSLERLGGQLAVALGRVQLVYYHPARMAGILRASHDTKYLVLAAMGLVRRIGGRRVLLIPVRTTGTIKRAKKALGLPLREARA